VKPLELERFYLKGEEERVPETGREKKVYGDSKGRIWKKGVDKENPIPCHPQRR